LREVLIALDLHDVDLLGHSMGCSVSWCYLDLFGAERLSRLILVDEAAAVTGNPSWPQAEREALDCLFPSPLDLAAQYHKVLSATNVEATADLLAGMFTAGVAREDLLWIAAENLKLPRVHAANLVYHHAIIDWRDVIPLFACRRWSSAGTPVYFRRTRKNGSPNKFPARNALFSMPAKVARISCFMRIRPSSTRWSTPF